MSDPYSKAVEAYKKGDTKKAIKNFKKAADLAEKYGKIKIKADILQSLAFAYLLDGNMTEGIKTMKEAVIIFDKTKQPIKVIEGLAYIGAINYKMNKNKLALKYYKEAERIIKEKNLYNQCRKIEADICADMGSIYDKENNFSAALECYNRAIKLYKKDGDKLGEGRTYLDLALLYYHNENYNDARSFVHKALNWLKKSSDTNSLADCYFLLGKIDFELKNWEKAISEFEKARALYEVKKNNEGIVESSLWIGASLIHIEDKELEAKKILEKSLTEAKKLKDIRIEGLCLAWLSLLKRKLGEKDAKKFKELALNKLSEIGMEKLMVKIK
ncbi:MAG: tetratricopeptide repeat protein [Candidatus Helarchaeota archaeon]